MQARSSQPPSRRCSALFSAAAPVPLSSITARTNIRSSLSRGAISQALSQLDSLVPDLLSRNPSLLLSLHQQALVELIRAGAVDEALVYARTHLRAACAEDPALLTEMEGVMALIAFAGLPLAANPARHLLDQRQRSRLGDKINQQILQAQFAVKESKLSILIKQMQAAQEALKKFIPQFPLLDCSGALSDAPLSASSGAGGNTSSGGPSLSSLLDPASYLESVAAREEAQRAIEARRAEEEAQRARDRARPPLPTSHESHPAGPGSSRADRESIRRARQRLAAAIAAQPRTVYGLPASSGGGGSGGEEEEEEAGFEEGEDESSEEMEAGEEEFEEEGEAEEEEQYEEEEEEEEDQPME